MAYVMVFLLSNSISLHVVAAAGSLKIGVVMKGRVQAWFCVF